MGRRLVVPEQRLLGIAEPRIPAEDARPHHQPVAQLHPAPIPDRGTRDGPGPAAPPHHAEEAVPSEHLDATELEHRQDPAIVHLAPDVDVAETHPVGRDMDLPHLQRRLAPGAQ